MEELQDIHLNQRCFIIGNGQSLNSINLSLLKKETCIGIDDAYMRGLDYKYYFVYDLGNWNKNYRQVLELDTALFISDKIYDDYRYMQPRYPRYCKGELRIIRPGELSNSAEMALILCYMFGFQKVYLLGCENYHSPLLTRLKDIYGNDNREIIDCGEDIKLLEDEIYTYTAPKCKICGSDARFDGANGRIFSVCTKCEFVYVVENR